MHIRLATVVLLFVCTSCGRGNESAPAQPVRSKPGPDSPPAVAHWQRWQRAQQFYDAERYAEARPLLDSVVTEAAQNGRAWILLGDCRYETGAYDAALTAYHRARTLGTTVLEGGYRYPRYHLAATHAQRGAADSALVWLQRLLDDRRFSNRRALRQSEALAPLQGNSRFEALTRTADGGGLIRPHCGLEGRPRRTALGSETTECYVPFSAVARLYSAGRRATQARHSDPL